MKKFNLLILAILSVVMLTACTDADRATNRPVVTPPDKNDQEQEQEKPGTDDPVQDVEYPFISTDPTFVTADMTSDVIVYINTTGTALDGFTGQIYAHTGVLTSASTSTGDWKHVKFDWNVNDNSCRLSKVE